jgi:hypothetical protein
MTAWGRIVGSALNSLFARQESPYLSVFRIEYNREYNFLVDQGYQITEQDAKNILKSMT